MEAIQHYMQAIKKLLTASLHPNQTLEPSPRAAKKRLHRAIRAMKAQSTLINGKKVPLDFLPWFLVIGTSGSGKTTLLANSKIKFLIEKSNIASAEPEMWVTPHGVLFDLPGKYFKNDATSAAHKLWPQFLDQIKKSHFEQGLSGVIMTLSLSEIMEKANRATLVETLENRMHELRTRFGKRLPFYIVITKCDLIPGFAEFFSDYGTDELEQIWGVPLSIEKEEKPLAEIFVSRFNVLINRLNKQLITRLYQERNIEAKFSIKDFPLQLEKFKNEFVEILKMLTAKHDECNFQGVYLTSATQEHCAESAATDIQAISSDTLQNKLIILQKPIAPIQPYFVKHFLLFGLTPFFHGKKPAENKFISSTHVMIACFLMLGMFFYTKDFDLNMSKNNQQLALTETHNDSSSILSHE